MYTLENSKYIVHINNLGNIVFMGFKEDAYRANFILASAEEKWVPYNKQWGMGFITSGENRYQIENCSNVKQDGKKCTAEYIVSYVEPRFSCVWDGNIEESMRGRELICTVTRELYDDGLYETFEIRNNSPFYVCLDEVGIYSSFHDTYVTEKHSLDRHVNQHFWMGGDVSYIEALRQSGTGKNLGLITLKGNFQSYQIEELNSSNFRGVIGMIAKDIRISANEAWSAKRVITDFISREEFQEKICNYTGFPVIDYGFLTVVKGESFCFKVKNKGSLTGICIDRERMKEVNGVYYYKAGQTGEIFGRIYFGDGKIALIKVCVIDDIMTLLRKRAHFIIDHQQVMDKKDPRYGAFLPYSLTTEKMMRVEEAAKLYHGIADRNESRERLGMGAFIAALARIDKDDTYIPALEKYCTFVEEYLIDRNYDVWDCYEQQASQKYYKHLNPQTHENQALDMRFRSFNYVFMLAFLSEMYWLTKKKHYAELVAGIMKRYAEKYGLGGNTCMFGVDEGAIRVIKDAGMTDGLHELEEYLHNRVLYLLKIDDNYDPSEVIYEQGTSASAMREIADYYLATKDESVLNALEKQKIRNLTFEGNQPDYRSYHAATIHWDDFWFGELELWGDTMPHYWDSISADAYYMYFKITGNREYKDFADYMFRDNLALINSDGSCWNCYIYPEKINGRQGSRLEPLSNDQDWCFYTYLKDQELLEQV